MRFVGGRASQSGCRHGWTVTMPQWRPGAGVWAGWEKRSAVRGTWRGHPSPGLRGASRHFTCRGGQPRGPGETPKRSLRRYAPHAGGGGSPNTSGTTGLVARNIVAISAGRSRSRWRAVRTTLATSADRPVDGSETTRPPPMSRPVSPAAAPPGPGVDQLAPVRPPRHRHLRRRSGARRQLQPD